MNEVIKSLSIENLVRQRDSIVERIKSAVSLIIESETIAETAKIGFPRFDICFAGKRLYIGGIHKTHDEPVSMMVAEIDAKAWRYLMEESGLYSLMDSTARKNWDEQTRNNVPELTIENIEATFARLHEGRGMMFERGVISVFQELSWNYKTNLPYKFGKKIIIHRLTDEHGRSIYNRRTDNLDDLIRVFNVLDGKPEPEYRGSTSYLIANARSSGKAIENDYMTITLYQNGNGHVYFKRPELVDQLNRILAKHYPNALPQK